MTKADFIKILAANNDLTKARATAIVEDAIEIIENNIKRGESVTFTGFGTFKPTTRKPKSCRNPRTGVMQEISEQKNVNFRIGKGFKALLNEND